MDALSSTPSACRARASLMEFSGPSEAFVIKTERKSNDMSRPVLKTILTDTLEIAYEEDGQTYGKPVISCIASLTTRESGIALSAR